MVDTFNVFLIIWNKGILRILPEVCENAGAILVQTDTVETRLKVFWTVSLPKLLMYGEYIEIFGILIFFFSFPVFCHFNPVYHLSTIFL